MIGNDRKVETIISAGIDIGTSTTKIIISRFSLLNMAGSTHVPKIEIIDKQILHKSPIYRTPLLDNDYLIDIEAVFAIVKQEYAAAGVDKSEIQTGAVIITGESAIKSNARQVIQYLSDEAGEFLVATAGPDLEGIIAAKGSGAHAWSQKHGKTIANIDIGGGTANIAVYKKGLLLGTCTLHVGGRLMEFDGDTVTKISPPVASTAEMLGIELNKGQKNGSGTDKILEEMVSVLVSVLNGDQTVAEHPLFLSQSAGWGTVPIDAVMFSGGVSECVYYPEHDDPSVYSDIGRMLAEKLNRSGELRNWEWVTPEETVRATVCGAGMQTTEISGATIQIDKSVLPLKNLPVIEVTIADMNEAERSVSQKIEQAIALYDPQEEGNNFALYFSDLPQLSFKNVQHLASVICSAYRQRKSDAPIVAVVKNDMAKVLGQSIMAFTPERSIICIDQLNVVNGDYVDIGRILDSGVVPVVIKTLAFQ